MDHRKVICMCSFFSSIYFILNSLFGISRSKERPQKKCNFQEIELLQMGKRETDIFFSEKDLLLASKKWFSFFWWKEKKKEEEKKKEPRQESQTAVTHLNLGECLPGWGLRSTQQPVLWDSQQKGALGGPWIWSLPSSHKSNQICLGLGMGEATLQQTYSTVCFIALNHCSSTGFFNVNVELDRTCFTLF